MFQSVHKVYNIVLLYRLGFASPRCFKKALSHHMQGMPIAILVIGPTCLAMDLLFRGNIYYGHYFCVCRARVISVRRQVFIMLDAAHAGNGVFHAFGHMKAIINYSVS